MFHLLLGGPLDPKIFLYRNDSNEFYSDAEVYADPGHISYEALNFAYGVATTFTPSVPKSYPDIVI